MSQRLRYEIEKAIDQWDGTVYGYQLKNLLENEQTEALCELLGLDPDME